MPAGAGGRSTVGGRWHSELVLGYDEIMFRRAIIAALTAGAISLAVLGWVGFWVPIYGDCRITDRLWCYFYTGEGLMRFYCLHGYGGIYLDSPNGFVRMEVWRADGRALRHVYSHASPNAIAPYAVLSPRWQPARRGRRPLVRLYGVRTWMWVPIAILAVYPISTFSRERIRQRVRLVRSRRGQCLDCGYNLTGLPEPRCPECGSAIRPE